MSILSSLMLIFYAFIIMSIILDFRLWELTRTKQVAAILVASVIVLGNGIARYLLDSALYGSSYFFLVQLPLYITFAVFSRYQGIKVFFALLSTIVFAAPPIMVVTTLRTFCQIDMAVSLMVFFICYVLMLMFVYHFLRQDFNYTMENCESRRFWIFCIIPILYYIYSFLRTGYNFLQPFAQNGYLFTQIPTIIVFASYILLVRVFRTTRENQQLENEKHIMRMQIESSRLYLKELKSTQEQAVTYRHDMRHHLSLIGSFAAEGDLAKIKDYLSATEADIDAITPVYYCENETANLIFSSFVKQANEKGVVLHTDVKLPHTLSISDTELCALLSNAVENAITAASQLEDEKLRRVYIRALVNDNKLLISTENAYAGEIKMESELPQSKNKETGHGIGIKSMVSIVERHHGLYSFETADGIFILQLMLPLQKEI